MSDQWTSPICFSAVTETPNNSVFNKIEISLSLQQPSRAGGAAPQGQEPRPCNLLPLLIESRPHLHDPRRPAPSHLHSNLEQRGTLFLFKSMTQALLLSSHWPGFHGLCNGWCSENQRFHHNQRRGELTPEGELVPSANSGKLQLILCDFLQAPQ